MMTDEQISEPSTSVASPGLDNDTGEGLLHKPTAQLSAEAPSSVATKLQESSDSCSEESSKSADILVVNDDNSDTSSITPAVGDIDVGELPAVELEEADKTDDADAPIQVSIVDKIGSSFTVSPERDSEVEEIRSRSDKEDTVSVKSSFSSQDESIGKPEKLPETIDTNPTQLVVAGPEPERKIPNTEIVALQSKIDETNVELQSYQQRVEELRQRLEKYEGKEGEESPEQYKEKLKSREEENSKLQQELEEKKGALDEAKLKENDLSNKLQTLGEEKDVQLRKNEEEVIELQAKIAELKSALDKGEQRENDLSEKNGVQQASSPRTNASRTSLSSAHSKGSRRKKQSKVCNIL